MASPEQFWQQLHTLAECYDRMARASHERSKAALSQFREITPQARQQLLADLFQLATELPNLYCVIAAAEREAGDTNGKRRRDSSAA